MNEVNKICYNKIDEFRIYLQDELVQLNTSLKKDNFNNRTNLRIAGIKLAIDKINSILNENKEEILYGKI